VAGAALAGELDADEGRGGREDDGPEADAQLDGAGEGVAQAEEPEGERGVVGDGGEEASSAGGAEVVGLVGGEVGREGEEEVDREGRGDDAQGRPRDAREEAAQPAMPGTARAGSVERRWRATS
jgi:hypothetical protein